jgi:hypothetical protein
VLANPVLANPVLANPVPADPVPADPVPADRELAGRTGWAGRTGTGLLPRTGWPAARLAPDPALNPAARPAVPAAPAASRQPARSSRSPRRGQRHSPTRAACCPLAVRPGSGRARQAAPGSHSHHSDTDRRTRPAQPRR